MVVIGLVLCSTVSGHLVVGVGVSSCAGVATVSTGATLMEFVLGLVWGVAGWLFLKKFLIFLNLFCGFFLVSGLSTIMASEMKLGSGLVLDVVFLLTSDELRFLIGGRPLEHPLRGGGGSHVPVASGSRFQSNKEAPWSSGWLEAELVPGAVSRFQMDVALVPVWLGLRLRGGMGVELACVVTGVSPLLLFD